MAHSEPRNQGILQRNLNLRYAKLQYGNVFKTDGSKKINPFKIEIELYNALIINGIKECNVNDFKTETGLNKSDALMILNEIYEKENNYYLLTKPTHYKELNVMFQFLLNSFSPGEGFNCKQVLKQLEISLGKINQHLRLGFPVNKILKKNESDIIICIMCLLHSHEFKLYDGNHGKCILSASRLNKSKNQLTSNWELSLNAVVNFDTSTFLWPLIKFDQKVDEYIPELKKLPKNVNYSIDLIFFNAVRNDNNKLIISNK